MTVLFFIRVKLTVTLILFCKLCQQCRCASCKGLVALNQQRAVGLPYDAEHSRAGVVMMYCYLGHAGAVVRGE
jgi:hypothetical protein